MRGLCWSVHSMRSATATIFRVFSCIMDGELPSSSLLVPLKRHPSISAPQHARPAAYADDCTVQGTPCPQDVDRGRHERKMWQAKVCAETLAASERPALPWLSLPPERCQITGPELLLPAHVRQPREHQPPSGLFLPPKTVNNTCVRHQDEPGG